MTRELRRVAESVLVSTLALVVACGESGGGDASVADAAPGDAAVSDAYFGDATAMDAALDDAALDAGGSDAGDPAPEFLTTLTSSAEFTSLSRAMSVKYILRVEGATPRPPLLETCYFQNTARYQFHIEFLRIFPELRALSFQDYEQLVLRPATRIWWGGGVIRVAQRHPLSGRPESLAYQIYAQNGAAVGLREADIVEVDALLRVCMPYAANLLAFQPGDPFQEMLARALAPGLAQRGIAVLLR